MVSVKDEEEKDGIERLLDDLDRAAEEVKTAEGLKVWRAYRGDSNGLPDTSIDTYSGDVLVDATRRLHALMPHDADGREIKAGDAIESGASTFHLDVTAVKIVAVGDEPDGNCRYMNASVLNPRLWRVVEPDSWERLEEDAKLAPSDYLGGCGLEANEHGRVSTMAADIVRRAKALAGVPDD